MYIHIGDDIVLHRSEVVAILDKKAIDHFSNENTFIKNLPLQIFTKETWKSIIITTSNYYLSPLSSSTLKKRLQMF